MLVNLLGRRVSQEVGAPPVAYVGHWKKNPSKGRVGLHFLASTQRGVCLWDGFKGEGISKGNFTFSKSLHFVTTPDSYACLSKLF